MAARIIAPKGGNTVPLTFSVSVYYNTTAFFYGAPAGVVRDDKREEDERKGDKWEGDERDIEWYLTCSVDPGANVTPSPSQRVQVPPTDENGDTRSFSFTVPGGDYTISTTLERVDDAGNSAEFGHDEQSPVHASSDAPQPSSITSPPPPGPPRAAFGAGGGPGREPPPGAPAPGAGGARGGGQYHWPVILHGKIKPNPKDPPTGLVIEIYRFNGSTGEEVVEFVGIPTIVGNTYSAVFPAYARRKHRHYRLYVIGTLGRILSTTEAPVWC